MSEQIMNDAVAAKRISEIAADYGFSCQRHTGHSMVFVRLPQQDVLSRSSKGRFFPNCIEVFLETGDAAIYIPHPRQKGYRFFRLHCLSSEFAVRDLFSNPWEDSQFSYRVAEVLKDPLDSLPLNPPLLAADSAIEKQISLISREIADLRAERNELRARYMTLHQSRSGGYHCEHPLSHPENCLVDLNDRLSLTENDLGLMDNLSGVGDHSEDLETDAYHLERMRHTGRQKASQNVDTEICAIGSTKGRGFMNKTRVGSPWSFERIDQETPKVAGGMDLALDRIRGNRALWQLADPLLASDFAKAYALKPVTLVSLGRTFVIVYDDGTAIWGRDISPLLERKLIQQGVKSSRELSGDATTTSSSNEAKLLDTTATNGPGKFALREGRIKLLTLGSDDNFFVKFESGRTEWCGPDSFGEALRRGIEKRQSVEKVAFGGSDAWIILWSNGYFDAENVPSSLQERLLRPRTRSDINRSPEGSSDTLRGQVPYLKDVTIGPCGEWFLIFKDHSVQADSLPDCLYKTLTAIRENGGRVRSILFGEDRSWFVRYWDGMAGREVTTFRDCREVQLPRDIREALTVRETKVFMNGRGEGKYCPTNVKPFADEIGCGQRNRARS